MSRPTSGTMILISSLLALVHSGCNAEPEEVDELVEFAYEGDRVPPGHYAEDWETNLYYVNTRSVAEPDDNVHEWIELCSDDEEEAWQWAEASATAPEIDAVYAALGDESVLPELADPADSGGGDRLPLVPVGIGLLVAALAGGILVGRTGNRG